MNKHNIKSKKININTRISLFIMLLLSITLPVVMLMVAKQVMAGQNATPSRPKGPGGGYLP